MEPVPPRGVVGGKVVVFFSRFKDRGVNALNELPSIGDNAIFDILAMTADRSLRVEADADQEEQA
jgi:hypothetical protein